MDYLLIVSPQNVKKKWFRNERILRTLKFQKRVSKREKNLRKGASNNFSFICSNFKVINRVHVLIFNNRNILNYGLEKQRKREVNYHKFQERGEFR